MDEESLELNNHVEVTFWSHLRQSALLGTKVSFALSTLYAIYSLLSSAIIYSLLETNGLSYVLLIGGYAGIAYGVLPATVFGAGSAIIIAGVLWLRKEKLTKRFSVALGLLIPFVVVSPIQLIFFLLPPPAFGIDLIFLNIVILWLVQPMFIFILAGGWVGWLIYTAMSMEVAKNSTKGI